MSVPQSSTTPVAQTSADLTSERLDALRDLIPEAFTEGKVDFDKLRAALGDFVDDRAERYSFTWAGKRDAIRLLQMPTRATLVPAKDESVNWDTTQNLFIEGDNLEVLKLLYKAYYGRVKMIYIDPPYNTGSDFIYADNFADPLAPYLQLTGQSDIRGNLVSSETETSGRFHSSWLNMMYPRLFVARQLMREDGVIFSSIDSRELPNLLKLFDEIFGGENFVGVFVWQSKKGGGSDNSAVVVDHEYVVCYARSNGDAALSRIPVDAEPLDKHDAKGPYRRGRELNKWGSNSRREDRPTMYFPIPGPDGQDVFPIRNDGKEGCWRWGKKKMLDIAAKNDVDFVRRSDGTFIAYEKIRSTDPRSKPYRTWLTDVGTTADGSKAVKELFGGVKVFDFPKPTNLIRKLLEMAIISDDDIVLDFFAGSATTAHSVLEHNHEAGVNLSYVCIQLPEQSPESSEARKQGYGYISDIGKERIRRVIEHFSANSELKLEADLRDTPENMGFRVFKLSSSHFTNWSGTASATPADYHRQLEAFTDPLTQQHDAEAVIWEVAIKEGYSLTSRVEAVAVAGHVVYRVGDPDRGQHFHICLDDEVAPALAAALGLDKEDLFVCRDLALDDSAAANLALQCRLKTI